MRSDYDTFLAGGEISSQRTFLNGRFPAYRIFSTVKVISMQVEVKLEGPFTVKVGGIGVPLKVFTLLKRN